MKKTYMKPTMMVTAMTVANSLLTLSNIEGNAGVNLGDTTYEIVRVKSMEWDIWGSESGDFDSDY